MYSVAALQVFGPTSERKSRAREEAQGADKRIAGQLHTSDWAVTFLRTVHSAPQWILKPNGTCFLSEVALPEAGVNSHPPSQGG